MLLTIIFPTVGELVRSEGVGEQTRTVLHFPAFGGLFAEFSGAVDVLRIDPRFRPVHLCLRIQPVVVVWRDVVGHLRITLNRGSIGHRVAAVRRLNRLRVFWLLRCVVVIA
ncbi:hypothetical protein D3C78_1052620 [compost metagenome]